VHVGLVDRYHPLALCVAVMFPSCCGVCDYSESPGLNVREADELDFLA